MTREELDRAPSFVHPSAKLDESVTVGPLTLIEGRVSIGASTKVGSGAILEQDVRIGAGCLIGHRVILHAGSQVGDNCVVRDGAVLGRLPQQGAISTVAIESDQPPVRLGNGCQVGANAVLYAGAVFGDDVLIGDLASVREGSTVGSQSIVGRNVMIEYGCQIGERVKIQTGCYITGETTIEEGAFLGPTVTMANDKFMDRIALPEMRGPHIGRGVRIGSNATLLPGVRLGDDCAIGAGAVVTRDVAPNTIVTGLPARLMKDVPPAHRLRLDPRPATGASN